MKDSCQTTHTHTHKQTHTHTHIYIYIYYEMQTGGARGVIVIVVGNGHGDSSPTLGETDCISHSTNTLGKGMNPIILPPAMGK